MRLTERQQFALAMEASLKGSQPTCSPGQYVAPEPQKSNRQSGGGESSSKSRQAPSTATVRRVTEAVAPASPRESARCTAGSDEESSAGPSAQRDGRSGADAAPAPPAPRKRRRVCDEADLSSSSQSCGRDAAGKSSSLAQEILQKKVESSATADKAGANCSESSRQSHTTSALPAIRVCCAFIFAAACLEAHCGVRTSLHTCRA